MTDTPSTSTIIAQELRIVDAAGLPRIVLSAKDGVPVVTLLRNDGTSGATVQLDAADRPSMRLSNPDADGPVVAVEVDDKGAHVKFDRPGGGSAYLFLNDVGRSGVVLIDSAGQRRINISVAEDGASRIERLGDGAPPAENGNGAAP